MIDGYNEAPLCSSFASGSFDIDVIFHVHCTKPVWCVTVCLLGVVDTVGDKQTVMVCLYTYISIKHRYSRVTITIVPSVACQTTEGEYHLLTTTSTY